MKLLKLNLIGIINCTTTKNLQKFGLLIFFKIIFKPQKREFSWKEESSVPIGWSLRFLPELRSLRSLRLLRCVACVELDGNPALVEHLLWDGHSRLTTTEEMSPV